LSKLDNLENWQKASVATSLILTLVLIVNTSLMAYMNYQSTFTASFMGANDLESIDINLKAEAGRPSPLAYYLRQARGWISAYFVGGTERTNAETGIVIAIDGTNIGSTASVDYYIEARESTGQGQPYRFLEGNGTSVTVNGADLDLTNQTTIENHLQAMGLSTTSSWTIDYYVYVKAEAIGAISSETLTSEITYQKFDSVTYAYGTEVTETALIEASADDSYCVGNANYFYATNTYVGFGDAGSSYYDYEAALRFTPDVPAGQDLESATLKIQQKQAFGSAFGAVIEGEDADNPNAPTSQSDLLGRTRTSANVGMTMGPWSDNTWHDSPDIQTVIEEIISRPGWSSGNAVILFLKDDEPGCYYSGSTLNIWSYDQGQSYAPKLELVYMTYSASWYPIGPVSVLSMPLGQTLGAVTVLALSCYAVYSVFQKEEKR